MKSILKVSLGVLASIFLVSCDVDQVGPEYTSAVEGVSFPAAKYFAAVPPTGSSFELPVMRANASAAATVNISCADYAKVADLVSIPSSVSFAAGEYEKNIVVSVQTSNLAVGLSYPFTLTLDATASVGGVTETTVSLSLDAEWMTVATGTFVSEFWEEEWEHILQQAEGTLIFRFPNLYYNNYHIQFELDENGNGIDFPMQECGYNYGGAYGMTYFGKRSATSDEYIKKEGNKITMYGYWGFPYYSPPTIPGFGSSTEVFTW